MKPPRQKPTVAMAPAPVRSRSASIGGGGVLFHLTDLQLLDVRHVFEVLVTRAEAGGAAEVVDRDCGVADLGEALGQLRVERVQAADVGQDHHPAALARGGLRESGRESGAVGRGQLEHLRPRATGDRGEHEVLGRRRWARVEVEAHDAGTQ